MKYWLVLFFVTTSLVADEVFDKRHILYLMSIKDFNGGIEQYLKYYEKQKKHDFDLLKEIGNIILDYGSNSKELDDQLITLFGISLSGKQVGAHFFESAIKSRYPVVEAAALNLLGHMHDDFVDEMIQLGLKSDYLQVRLEALHLLIARKAKNALGQVESLSSLLPPQFLPYFVEFYAVYASNESIRKLKQLITNPDANVRIAAILSAAFHTREDLLPNIRAALTHSDPALKEAAASALGQLQDLSSLKELKLAAQSPFPEARLAALHSLSRLGDKEAKEQILKLAEEENLFAIQIAGQLPESIPLLKKLLASENKTTELNAALALLKNRDSSALKVVEEILTAPNNYVCFAPFSSPGHSFVAWKPVSPASITMPEAKRNLKAITTNFQEETLAQCIDLPEKDFLYIANLILQGKQNRLIPKLMKLMENVRTDSVKDLLKSKANSPGVPLIRAYCNLALYRLSEGKENHDAFIRWLEGQHLPQLIEFKPMIDRGAREDKSDSNYELTPEENSGLLIEAFDALASKHDLESINLILQAMKNGHDKNRYALAGLLLKSIQ